MSYCFIFQGGNFDSGARWDAPEDFEEVIVDLKGKGRGGSRRASSTGAMPGLPQIGGGGQFGKSPTGYSKQGYPGSASPSDRGRSPSAGPNGRVDWKAKYLK